MKPSIHRSTGQARRVASRARAAIACRRPGVSPSAERLRELAGVDSRWATLISPRALLPQRSPSMFQLNLVRGASHWDGGCAHTQAAWAPPTEMAVGSVSGTGLVGA